MRQLTRRESVALRALERQIERNPGTAGLVAGDYAQSRPLVHDLRELLERRVLAATRDPDEPGSKPDARATRPWGVESRSNLQPGDGCGRYGDRDHTGFSDGVY